MAKRAAKKDPVRWGVISTARIGWEKVLPGMMKSKDIEIRAIASRTLPTAKKWAKKLGIPVAYGSYEDMLDDPDIEVVYNPLPNHLHVPLTLAAAAKGKHVLCEKPIALTAKEAEKLRSAPGGVLIAEAFMVRQHPQWLKARQLAQSGKLGTLRAIQCLFSYHNVDPEERPQHRRYRRRRALRHRLLSDRHRALHLRRRAAAGDGGDRPRPQLQDRPHDQRHPRLRRGPPPHLHGFDADRALPAGPDPRHQGAARGRDPVQCPAGRRDEALLDDGKKFGDASAKLIKIDKADQYQLQGEYFSRVVRGKEKIAYGVEDAILQARVLDAVFRSAKTGKWEKP